MLRFSGKKLHKDDMKLMREVSKFTMDKFIKKSTQDTIYVRVKLVDDMKGWSGECYYMGNFDGIRVFDVKVSVAKINKRAKNPFARLQDPMKTLIHELVHVKQYANNQLFDYKDGASKFEGWIYKRSDSLEDYWDSPWEIEAYGRTEGLFEMFVHDMKKRAKKA
jgi:hypothetical protein